MLICTAGKRRLIFGENVRQHVEAGGFVGADGQRAARRAGLVGHGAQRFVAQREQPPGIFEQGFARDREPHGFPDAVEQLLPVFLLELADLRAYGRLRAVELLTGARKTALFGDFHECNQMVEVHSLVMRIIAKTGRGDRLKAE